MFEAKAMKVTDATTSVSALWESTARLEALTLRLAVCFMLGIFLSSPHITVRHCCSCLFSVIRGRGYKSLKAASMSPYRSNLLIGMMILRKLLWRGIVSNPRDGFCSIPVCR